MTQLKQVARREGTDCDSFSDNARKIAPAWRARAAAWRCGPGVPRLVRHLGPVDDAQPGPVRLAPHDLDPAAGAVQGPRGGEREIPVADRRQRRLGLEVRRAGE